MKSAAKETLGEQHHRFWSYYLRKPTFVYVLQYDGWPDLPVKIGFTKNIETRRKTFQTAVFADLRLLHCYPGTLKTEHGLQRFFKQRDEHVRGEWFDTECLEILRNVAKMMVAHYESTGAVADPLDFLPKPEPPTPKRLPADQLRPAPEVQVYEPLPTPTGPICAADRYDRSPAAPKRGAFDYIDRSYARDE